MTLSDRIAVEAGSRELDEGPLRDESWAGYMDGRASDGIPPGDNRSSFYKHGYRLGQAEIEGAPIPAQVSRDRWADLIHAREAGE